MEDEKIYIKTKNMPLFRLIPTVHFILQLLKRSFELSILIPAYFYVKENINSIKRGVQIEHTIGFSTIVYIIDEMDRVNLITGWKGER